MTLHSDAKKLNWSMIGVIVVLGVNTVALVFYGGGLDQRISSLERVVQPLSNGTLVRLDERTLAMKEQLDRIEQDDRR